MYWGIPPEVNAFRLTMAGAGPTAHVPQLTGFETAGVTHAEQATQMAVTAAETATSFVGSGGAAMMAAALTQTAWMTFASAHAQQAAATIGAGVGAYGSAVAATIPFPTVVANRIREATLEATNILGQNTPAIAETNAEYAEYWGQNAGAMMGYLGAVTGLLGSLSTPLPVMPSFSNPAAAIAAGVAATGMSLGLQGAGIALSQGTQAGTSMGSAGAGVASLGAGVAAASAGQASQAGQGSSSTGTWPGASGPGVGGGEQLNAEQALEPAQAMMGSALSAPSSLLSSAGSMLSQAQGLPSSMGGQLSSLFSPALSAASGGLGGGGTPGLGALPWSAAGSPWSGLSGANGGFAGGGSAVSAVLTKPSAGAGMAGPMGVPSAWWNNIGDGAEKASAGVRGAGSASAAGPMGSGMYGMPAGAGSQRRKTRDPAEADKGVFVGTGAGDAVPVYTDAGVVYVQGQEV
jgi:hypothetical protein